MYIQNTNTRLSSLKNSRNFGHARTPRVWQNLEIKGNDGFSHFRTQHHIPSTLTRCLFLSLLWGPHLWTPTDSFQSALEPRGSSLPLEPVSDTVSWDCQRQSQRPLQPGGTKWNTQKDRTPPRQTHTQTHTPLTLRTARTAVVVVLKGSLYRNALFMIVIIIIVMII